ncbi:hypothetical protein [Hydrogenophaga sp.]|uniref:hypothetical protein n=1 Tax=Hydrogenophaga sp. TaxID=1904254 RepID=UPI002727C6A5|nr:hypothetical protein [Hydrogenophaga sp.]MDO9435056.1 hypothetical protein [Hydrogenophaga sp.]
MSSNVPNAMAGNKPPPLQTSNSSVQTTAPTPDQRLSAWNALLGSVALKDGDAARKLLAQVANGFAPPDDAPLAQAVFNDLIQHEAHAVFVEVFNAYNGVRAAQVRAPGEPAFKSSLTLQLPADWQPSDPAALQAMLQKLQVTRLEVIHPKVDTSPYGALSDPTAKAHISSLMTFQGDLDVNMEAVAQVEVIHDLASRQHDLAVPKAVCESIVTLLQAGITELVVRGRLAMPEEVAHALSWSQLRSIDLGHENPYADAVSTATLDSYGVLMQALAKCASLEQLVLERSNLLSLHAKIEGLALGCPKLKSVQVNDGDTSNGVGSNIAAFAKIAAQCKTLEVITLKGVSTHALPADVFEPLRGHPKLATLEIRCPRGFVVRRAEDWGVLPALVRFSKSCPSLRHLKLLSPPISGGAAPLVSHEFLKVHPSTDEAMTAEFLLDPTIDLETLTVTGAPISHLYLSAVLTSIENNKTLTGLDISECLISAQAALDWPSALINNETLRTGKLPTDPRLYFIVSGDKRLHGMTRNFRLNIAADADANARESAQAAYDYIEAIVNAAPTGAQHLLDQKRAAQANAALALRLGGLLQAAAPPRFSSIAFNDIAKGILPYVMAEAQELRVNELRDAVHWSEVGPQVDPHGARTAMSTPDSLKEVVTAANAHAVAKNLPTAPLRVNKVDAQHGNQQLRAAVKSNDPAAVRALKEADAIDFHRLALRDVASIEVLNALQNPVPAAAVVLADTTADAPIDGNGAPTQG